MAGAAAIAIAARLLPLPLILRLIAAAAAMPRQLGYAAISWPPFATLGWILRWAMLGFFRHASMPRQAVAMGFSLPALLCLHE